MRPLTVLLSILLLLCACNKQHTLFSKITPEHSGITFNNLVTESDSINPLDLEFLYNGGGVAVGDFNNDGLQDLYFTASQVSNKLYINKGGFKFDDVTETAKVTGNGAWCNGASVVDINNDGLQDIYVCTTIKSDPSKRKNLLYINQGLDKNHVPVFKEMAAEYGLADTGYSVQAAFFDYDNDGDLDMYLVETRLTQRDATQFAGKLADTSKTDVDKLFRNDWNAALKHPVFTDVSAQAYIVEHGYGLGINIADINNDGWKDIYVTNDFFGSDLLYINNHDGTFTNKAAVCFKHTSQNAMGNDVADINNDGLGDIVAVDMNPEDNYRKKTNMNRNNYNIYQSMLNGGYVLQTVRNTLQLNLGPAVLANDTIGSPVFADIGFYAGIAETDWSWNPSVADFDNDGSRDIFITNGYPRDVTDHDFGAFRTRATGLASKQEIIDQIPKIKISNYAFKNNGGLHFNNVAAQWGLAEASFSNGAVYVDLDNDGDLDYVVNNIDDHAFLFENTLNTKDKTRANYLKIKFTGDAQNVNGLGAIATIFYNKGIKQVWENAPVRGYLSCVENSVQFGLDSVSTVDSVVVQWKNNRRQKLYNVKANQVLTVIEKDAVDTTAVIPMLRDTTAMFTDVTAALDVHYRHAEPDYIDFNQQKLLLHKFSEYGPGIAAGDIDGNGLDDICIGGTGDLPVQFLLQQSTGKFIQKSLPFVTGNDARRPENEGILLFDADNDGDLDLYLTSGSNEFIANTKNYQDRLFVNDGRGNYLLDTAALPINYTSKSCVKAADIDNDGDLDLFVGGRVLPGSYPQAVSSFIYRNDSKAGKIIFTDVTTSVAPALKSIGLTSDAVFTDFDNDGWTDLILAGEWMPISFFKNKQGRFEDITASAGLAGNKGWWNSIAAGDFDNDGDIDYVVGNLGTNSFYRASAEHPIRIYGGDIAHTNNYVSITTLYLPDGKGGIKEFPAQSKDDVLDPLPTLKKKYQSYKDFASAGISEILPAADLNAAYKLEANDMQSCYIQNLGNGKFAMHALPQAAQFSSLFAMVVDDINGDGNLDVAGVGNDYGGEPSLGRYDAMNGLVMLGDGKGGFEPLSILQSGIFIPGNAKSLVKLKGRGDSYLLAAPQNRDVLKLYNKRTADKLVPLLPTDSYAIIYLKNGGKRREEVYNGSSFLSQSSHFLLMNQAVAYIEIANKKGEKRKVGP